MKKILAIIVAMMMVMALSVSVFAEEVVYALGENDTLGQHLESVSIAGGGVLPADDPDGVGSRIATNWVNGTVFDSIVNAAKTEGAVLKITYTGTIKQIGWQTENGNMEMTDVTDVSEVDGKNVAIVPCADLVANAPVATSGDFGGWGNFIITQDGEVVLSALEIVTGYEAAAPATEGEAEAPAAEAEAPAAEAEAPAAEAEAPAAEAEAPAADAPAAPNTGIALAVVPAVMALAAVAVSKKH